MAVSQFELARKRAGQAAATDAQAQDDALKRRYAAQGALNSGSYVKQQQVAADNASKRKADAMEGIDVAEANEAQRQKEITEGRAFQTSERLGSQGFANEQRLGSQGFASGESALQRRFMTDERLGSQGFQSGEADKQRGFMTGERLSSQDFAAGQAQKQMEHQQAQFDKSYGLQREVAKDNWDMGLMNYNLEASAQKFNQDMAEWEKSQAGQGIVASLLGSGGIFGTLSELFGGKIIFSGGNPFTGSGGGGNAGTSTFDPNSGGFTGRNW